MPSIRRTLYGEPCSCQSDRASGPSPHPRHQVYGPGLSQLPALNNQHHADRPTTQGATPRFDLSFHLSTLQLFRSLPQPPTNLVVCFPSPQFYARPRPPAGGSRETARASTISNTAVRFKRRSLARPHNLCEPSGCGPTPSLSPRPRREHRWQEPSHPAGPDKSDKRL